MNARSMPAAVIWLVALVAISTAQPSAAAAEYTWVGSAGASWDTSSTNWTGATGTPWDSTSGPGNVAGFTASGSAAISGTVYANGLNFASGTGTVSISGGTLELAGTTPTLTTTAATQTLSLAGPLAGTAGLSIVGPGTTILSGNNSGLTGVYSIGTGVETDTSGIVQVDAAAALAGATSVSLIATGDDNGLRGQVLRLANGVTITGKSLAFTRTLTNRGSLHAATGSTASWDGDITLSADRTYLWADGTLTIGSSAATTAQGTVILRGSGTGILNSSIPSGALQKTEGGSWTITSTNNSFTGQVNIFAGTLSVASLGNSGTNSSLGRGTAIALGSGTAVGTLRFTGAAGGGTNRPISLVGGTSAVSGGVVENAVAGQTLTLSGNVSVFNNAAPAVFRLGGVGDGVFGGGISATVPVSVTKLGSGTWTFSGSNNTTGVTDVSAGTLAVTGTLSGAVNVASGARLGGTGSFGGLVTVAGGGILAPGTSPGTLSFGSGLTLVGTSLLAFELSASDFTVGGGVNDLAAVTGDLSLAGVLNVSPLGAADFSAVPSGSAWTLFTYAGGSFTNSGLTLGSLPSPGSGRWYEIDTDTAGEVNLVIVPEPVAPAMILVGGLVAGAWFRCDRRGKRRWPRKDGDSAR